MKVNIITLGCSKNTVDSENLAGRYRAEGHQVYFDRQQNDCDMVVINTCGFIGDAKEESINTILAQIAAKRRRHNRTRLVVCGCLVQRYRDELAAEMPEVDEWQGVERGVWSVECGEIVDDLYERVVETTKESAEVLRQLHERYPIAIVSNFYGNLPTVLREFGFDGLYDHLVESAVVGVRKPDPAIFTMGVEALGMQPEEVMVVGDSLEKDILPAREAGCQTVHFAPSLPRSLTLTETPLVIHDLKELLEIIA